MIITIKIGEKVRINAIVKSLVPARVLLPPIRTPIDNIAKLKIIKGTTTRKNPKPQPPPKSLKLGIKLIVMISAIDAEMIEISPRVLEAAFLTLGAEFFSLLFNLNWVPPFTHNLTGARCCQRI